MFLGEGSWLVSDTVLGAHVHGTRVLVWPTTACFKQETFEDPLLRCKGSFTLPHTYPSCLLFYLIYLVIYVGFFLGGGVGTPGGAQGLCLALCSEGISSSGAWDQMGCRN